MQDKSMITLLWESLNRMEAGRDPEAGAANRSWRTGFGSDKEQKGDREG